MEDRTVISCKQLINISDNRSDQPARTLRWNGYTIALHNLEKQLEVEFPPDEGVQDDLDPILKSNRGGLGVVRKGRVIDGSKYIAVVVKFRRFNIDAFEYHKKKVQSLCQQC